MELDELLLETRKRNMDNILNVVCYHTQTPVREVLSKSRQRQFVDCRRLIYTLIREIYNYPLLVIGKYFGKNHATIIHQLKVHKQLCEYGSDYQRNYNKIKDLMVINKDSFVVSEILIEQRNYLQNMVSTINEQIIRNNESKEEDLRSIDK
tara:strand:+ start:1957 stop:2409 length:453 start_codon:yes stop_codon:yes gene_type:complete